MSRNHADYVYRNSDDTVRVRIFRRATNEWDYDVFTKNARDEIRTETFSVECGDLFRTKRDALAATRREYGDLVSFDPGANMTTNWKKQP